MDEPNLSCDDAANALIREEANRLCNVLRKDGFSVIREATAQAEVILDAMKDIIEAHSIPGIAQHDILDVCRKHLERTLRDELKGHGFSPNVRIISGWPLERMPESHRTSEERINWQVRMIQQMINAIDQLWENAMDFAEVDS